jgi:hypothetical protein
MYSLFSKNRLTCRRCGSRFYRKVIFVSSEKLSKAVDPPRLMPLPRLTPTEAVVVDDAAPQEAEFQS